MSDLGGRPSKFTPERCAAIIDSVSKYVPYEIAAVANGISERTFYSWMEQGKDDLDNDIDSEFSRFLQAIKSAEQNKIITNAGNIAAKDDKWQADGWLLERRHWKHFSNNAPLVELNKRLDELEAAKKDKDNG